MNPPPEKPHAALGHMNARGAIRILLVVGACICALLGLWGIVVLWKLSSTVPLRSGADFLALVIAVGYVWLAFVPFVVFVYPWLKTPRKAVTWGAMLAEVLIIGIPVWAISYPVLSKGIPPAAREVAAKAQIQMFTTALDTFEIDCGRLPSNAEGFNALTTRPAEIPENLWHGPYLNNIPKDPWGHDYVYRCPGLHNTNRFDIYSCGPDGVSKSGGQDTDDISIWPRGGVQR